MWLAPRKLEGVSDGDEVKAADPGPVGDLEAAVRGLGFLYF